MSGRPPADVLLLAYSFPPSNAAGAARPARFAKYLGRFGYRATVITATRPQDPSAGEVIYVADREPAWQKRLWRLGIEAGLSWIRPATRAAGELLSKRRFDAVLSTSPPLAAHAAG